MTSLLSFFLMAQRNSQKEACIHGVGFTSIIMEREKVWDLKAILAGRLQISCLGDFYGSLPCQQRHSDSDGNTPKSFVYTRHFVIVFGLYDELYFKLG
jgi:hypothetical protein